MRRVAPLAVAALSLALLAAAMLAPAELAAAPPPHGALRALSGPGACLGPGCSTLRGPRGLLQLAISSDGRSLYLTGQGGGLGVLRRNRNSGRLTQLPGVSGCIRRDGHQNCKTDTALRSPGGVIVTPDGRNVYVTSAHGVLVFARNRGTGAIRAVSGAGGCVDAVRPGCRTLTGMSAPTALIAAGNRIVYVAGTTPSSGPPTNGALAVLSRNPATGALTQLTGPTGCFNAAGSPGCAPVPCLDSIISLALSRDGAHLYTGATNGLDIESTGQGDVATFLRSATTGGLGLVGCAAQTSAVADLVAVPHRTDVFVDSLFGDRGTGIAFGMIDRYAPQPTGLLTRTGQLACTPGPSTCHIPIGPDQSHLAITPSGRTLYQAVFFGGIASFRVSAHSVGLLPGANGCLVARRAFSPPPQCRRVGQQIAGALVVSPDGRNLYAGTLGNPSGRLYTGGIEGFRIQP
jgi:hypothetical protein